LKIYIMKFKKITSSHSENFNEIWKLCESSFPPDERRDFEKQIKIFYKKSYTFYAVYNKDLLMGIIDIWNLGKFAFIGHLAVKEKLRGQGFGTKLLKDFITRRNKKIVLEVERPNTNAAKIKIKFYEKQGFKLNKYNYIQPPYNKDNNSVPLFLMTYPKAISKSEFSKIRKKIHTTVYECEKPYLGIN